MEENSRRQLSIARKLATWAAVIPGLLKKIDVVLELPHITEAQAFDIELIVVRIESVFMAIGEEVEADASYDRLIANIDRLGEEIKTADATLDQLLKPNSDRDERGI